MAFSWPVHTREDTLGYIILLAGLGAIVRNKPLTVLAFSLLGVLCRETLLIIPFVYLFFSHYQKRSTRILIAGVPIIVFLLVRVFVEVDDYYGSGPFAGLAWNLNNYRQVVGFIFITFGAFWIPFIFSFGDKVPAGNERLNIMINSAPYAFLLIFCSTLLVGIFNEIRLLFLAFPWVITLSLWSFTEHQRSIKGFIKNRYYKFYLIILSLSIIVLTRFVLGNFAEYYGGSEYNIPFDAWIMVAVGNIYFTLIVLPIYTGFLLKSKNVND
jgi:hypothetical protein